MYLTRLEIQGFKSFADKIVLELPVQQKNDGYLLTAIVGPNGSGKSNIADAVRWVLGEQSNKAVRGSKSEDAIFSGSQKRGRASMAEVSLVLNNEDRTMPLDQPEVKFTRRLYRDSTSEYLINNNISRLGDIQMLLAQANFGKESYSVIAQGTIDHLLLMGGEERKTFFDEATGVRHLQIKKDQAIKKLLATKDNLQRAELLKDEIEPRLSSLTRQVHRLEKREALEKELFELQKKYFSTLWRDLENQWKQWQTSVEKSTQESLHKRQELKNTEGVMSQMAREETKSTAFLRLQKDYEAILEKRQQLKEKEFILKSKSVNGPKQAAAVNLEILANELAKICETYDDLLSKLQSGAATSEILVQLEVNTNQFKELVRRFEKDGPKSSDQSRSVKELEAIAQEISSVNQNLEKIQNDLRQLNQREEAQKTQFLQAQKQLFQKQEELRGTEQRLNEGRVELARVEVRHNTLLEEMRTDLQDKVEEIKGLELDLKPEDVLILLPEIQKLKRQLEWIGGIDPEVMKEYGETKERHSFLQNQSGDLKESLQSLIELAGSLNSDIQKRFEQGFAKINEKFNEYFRLLFHGGQAKLVKIEAAVDDELTDDSVSVAETPDPIEKLLAQTILCGGIEIVATPPGKKLKNINVLSGGEKALTAIALLSAIIAVNPSPFVVLDEVDAALDESNSVNFANILTQLSNRTQFIVITHNRATMQAASLLYGVTMGMDSASRVLSLKLEEAKALDE